MSQRWNIMIKITMKRRRNKTKINCWIQPKIKRKREFRMKMIIIIKVINIETKLIEY